MDSSFPRLQAELNLLKVSSQESNPTEGRFPGLQAELNLPKPIPQQEVLGLRIELIPVPCFDYSYNAGAKIRLQFHE
jgi:hypothetical protein